MPSPALIPAERLAWYDRVIATIPGLERNGKTVPYTSVNGHMTSFLTPEGSLALRLPREARDAFLQRYDARLHEAHGTVMREYVSVPDDLFADTERLAPHVAESYAYETALPPKATTRRKG